MLKRLELVGFKSFCHKTVLDFAAGITVIVGPNGSGKSNIIDALRWLLGEREAKSVRGAKSEDLIFSGTNQKARTGLAQAALYFDNSNNKLPMDFSEIVIVRKIHRDGSSEYLLNKSSVRLKDIVNFFAQSGMGTKGFSIINQGDGDLFIKASPQERREMMEEILGLRQYQIKKHESELKLKHTLQNLEKTQLAVYEIEPRLRILRKQANKWQKRAIFAGELRDLEDQYFGYRLAKINKEYKKLDNQLSSLNKIINRKKQELKELQVQVDKIEKRKPELNTISRRRLDLQKQAGKLEAQLAFLSNQNTKIKDPAQAINLLKEIRDKLRSPHPDLQAIIKKINSFLSSQNETENNQQRIKLLRQLDKVQKELAQLDKEESENRRFLEDFNKIFRQAFEALSLKRNEISRLENEKNRLLLQKDRGNYQWQELKEKIALTNRPISYFEQLTPPSFMDEEKTEQRIAKLRNELAALGEIDEELVKEAQEVEERYQFLSSQIEDLTKASNDLQKLISDLDYKISNDFKHYFSLVNKKLSNYFQLIFNDGKARLIIDENGIGINVNVPSKGIKGIDALSGGEKSLLSIAVMFALIAVNPPPFLVLDEVDAALDEKNSRRFAELLKKFSQKTQFIIVTHNRAVMEIADALYGIAMNQDGISKVLSLKLS